MLIDPVIQYAILGAFALLFAFSALEKWNNQEKFELQLSGYQIVPETLMRLTAQVVLFTEFVIAVLLISPAYLYGVVCGFGLLALYTGAITLNLLRGRTHIDCGCLGSSGEGLSYFLVLRNLTLLAVLAIATNPSIAREFTWLDFSTVLLAILCGVLGYFTASELIKNHMNARHWWG